MTRWDQYNERFFLLLANLSFEKAKEFLDRESTKFHPDFLPHFNNLLQYERSYHNLAFVHFPKGNSTNNRRERTLCELYSEMNVTLLQYQSNLKSNSTLNEEMKESNSIKQFISGLSTFLAVRTHLIKLYELISNAVRRNEKKRSP